MQPCIQNRRTLTMSSSSIPEFGPNGWLVQERYEQFLADPGSVDKVWRDFFAPYGAGRSFEGGRAVRRPRRAQLQPPFRARCPTARRMVDRPPAPAPCPRTAGTAGRYRPRRRPGSAARRLATPPRSSGWRDRQRRPPPTTWSRRKAAKAARAAQDAEGARPDHHPVAWGRRGGGEEHDVIAGGADRDVGAGGAGEADGRQPDRDQQLPEAEPRRQDLLHPPDRLRDRPGDRRLTRT